MLKLIFVLLLCLTGLAFAQGNQGDTEFYCHRGDCDSLFAGKGTQYDGPADDLWEPPAFCYSSQLTYYSRFLIADTCRAAITDTAFGWVHKPTYPIGTKLFVWSGEMPCYVFRLCYE